MVAHMTEIFSEVFTWITSAMQSVLGVFYNAETGFTVLGILAIIALAISIFFLLVGVISNFLHLRG